MNDYLRDRLIVAVGTQYQVERELGRGGMSVVYRAIDTRLHRTVAIKVLPPDIAFNEAVRTRFIREAQTAAQLSHPNIVPIYSVDEVGGEGSVSGGGSLVFFVMAYVDGESLGQRLAREGQWPVDQTVRVLREVADALAYAHARGVVHRDIKPDNILIDRASGRPMVTDFGIARARAGETRITATGVAVGTPAYMSPEQALGERDVDGRSDLYSLAVVGYHMLTGDTPFQAVNTPAMLVKHVSERPRPIRERRSDVPAYLAVAIDRALAKKPEDRWSDAAEFRDALAGAQASHRRRQAWTPPSSQIPPYPGGTDRSASLPVAASPAAPSASPVGSPPRHFPLPPPGMSRKQLRRWYKDQRKLLRAEERAAFDREIRVIGIQLDAHNRFDERPLDERVDAFRHSVMNWAGLSGVLMFINAMAGGPPWFVIPSGLMFLYVLRRGGSIWTDGVGPIDAFKKGIRARLRAERGAAEVQKGIAAPPLPLPPPPTPEQLAAPLAPPDVLAGPYGETIKRAAADRALMRDITSSFGAIEKELIPDVGPTVDALAQRVGVVATTLHRLDADVSGASLGALDQRLASLQSEPDTPERERRESLLQRQRNSLADLLERRRSLASQLESASLMLQNLKLDLLKFRSSGLGSQIEDNTHATQEARALSRDIGHAVQAAEELRKL